MNFSIDATPPHRLASESFDACVKSGREGAKSVGTDLLFDPPGPVKSGVLPETISPRRVFCLLALEANESQSSRGKRHPQKRAACQFTAFSQHAFTHAFGAGKSQGTCGKRLMGEPLRGVIRRTSQSSSSYSRDSRLRIPVSAKGLLLTDAKCPMFKGMKAWRTTKCNEGAEERERLALLRNLLCL